MLLTVNFKNVDLISSSSGCARLGSGVAPSLGAVFGRVMGPMSVLATLKGRYPCTVRETKKQMYPKILIPHNFRLWKRTEL